MSFFKIGEKRRFVRKWATALAVAFVSVFPFSGCSSDSHVAGNSAETGSPELAGLLVLDNGKPAAFARVQCVPRKFDATSGTVLPQGYSTETDSVGYYSLDSIPEGFYSLEAYHEASGKMLLVQNLAVVHEDSLAVSDTLRESGSVEFLVDEIVEDGTTGIATVIGTTILRPVVVRGGVLLVDSLPADSLSIRIYLDKDTLESRNTVVPADTVLVSFKKDSADTVSRDTIPEDTTEVEKDTLIVSFMAPLALPASADTLDSFVSDIPLALRLTPKNCDFDTLSGMDGRWEVVRVSQDGARSKKLPISNAYFDTLAQEAVFWVRVDSLNVTDSLELTFDNTLKPAFASDMFPTNRAYSLVWRYDSGIDPVVDAAEKRYFDGTSTGATLVDGVLGSAVSLKADSYIVASNSAAYDSTRKLNLVLNDDEYLCFSLWVQLKDLETAQTIFEMPNREYALRYDPAKGFVVEVYHIATQTPGAKDAVDTLNAIYTWESGTAGIAADQWVYVAFSMHTPFRWTLFLDDTQIEAKVNKVEWDGIRGEGDDFKLGGFSGKVDELMLGGCFRDESWTRLTYLNQKPDGYWPVLTPKL